MVEFKLEVVNQGADKLVVTQRDLENMTRDAQDNEVHESMKQLMRCKSVQPCFEGESFSAMDGDDDDETKRQFAAADIVLVKLGPNQRLSFRARATKGIGKEHAKFTPVGGGLCAETEGRFEHRPDPQGPGRGTEENTRRVLSLEGVFF